MKKISSILATAACVFVSQNTFAGSVGISDPQCNWSGFYAGANGGYDWGSNNTRVVIPGDAGSQATYSPFLQAGVLPRSINYDQDGFIGGAQFGYNFQFHNFLLGAEVDVNGVNIDGSETINLNNIGTDFSPSIISAGSTLEWLGTVRGRIGYIPTPQALVYATGGLAYGSFKHRYNAAIPTTNDLFTSSNSSTKTGYTVGGGLEWMFEFKWSVKAEYLYYNLDNSIHVTTPGGRDVALVATGLFRPYSNIFKSTGNMIRLGVNYHFN